jgi:signal transduction histidine kinase
MGSARWAQVRIATITAQERQRIAADLHDDLGAKLLTIVHTSADERSAQLGREALDEMRLSVRGLSGRPALLAHACADWRSEVWQRLQAAGVALQWSTEIEDDTLHLSARTVVQTTRILREVLNNLIRHSRATRCRVRLKVRATDLLISLQDNGRGFNAPCVQAAAVGQGLLNMQVRARRLQGVCRIESRPGQGTRVSLEVPLQAGPEPTAT